MNIQPTLSINGKQTRLNDRERSAMWHAKQRCLRKGIPFNLQDELIRYHAKVRAREQKEGATP